MKTIKSGGLSYALVTFNALKVCSLLVLLQCGIIFTLSGANPEMDSPGLMPEETLAKVSLVLNGSYPSSSYLVDMELFVGEEGFEGMWSESSFNPSSGTIIFLLQGGQATALPANQDIALLTLIQPDSPDRNFLVKTDGGGVMILLEDY